MSFTRKDVRRAMIEVVAEKGADYTYPTEERVKGVCRYANAQGEPSCIVGHVIHKLDEDAFNQLARAERAGGGASASELIHLRYLPKEFWDTEAAAFASMAQSCQDRGNPWGDALSVAEDWA